MKIKKLATVLLIIMLTFGLAACSGDGGSSEGSGGVPVVTVNLGEEPKSIDPALHTTLDEGMYLNHLFERLVTIDQNKNFAPGAAKSWDISDDETVYTYHLREDAKWSDGEPLTANDFLYAWQRLIDPATAAEHAHYAYYIKNAGAIHIGEADMGALGVKALDAHTLEVTLEAPVVFWNQLMSFACFSPLRADIVETDPEGWANDPTTYISNGPFKMKEWAHGQYMYVVKNPEYWNADGISDIDIKFTLMADENTIYAAFQNGELMYVDAPVLRSELTKAETTGTLSVTAELSTYYYVLNNEKEFFKDVRIRKALALAINRQFLVDNIWKNKFIPAGAQVGPGFIQPGGDDFREAGGIYLDPSPESYDTNVAEAKKLMSEAGFPDGKGFPTLEFLTNDTQTHIDIAKSIRQMWKENLGININISQMEWSLFVAARQDGDFDITRDVWTADFEDPVTMLDLYLSSGIGANNGPRYNSKKFDDLITQSRAERDPDKRMELLHQAEDTMIGEDWAMIPIAHYAHPILTAPNLKGVVNSSMGYPYFMWCFVEE